MGWVPGEITSLDDPAKLGRVRVRCDLIQPDTDLPNSTDGWVWVSERFVNNAIPGGSHRLLKVGTQVALLPMLGDPRYMLLVDCIPSRIDTPHPDLDRAKEIHGSATPGQVFDFHNDGDASSLNARPHGTLQHISGDGNITYQTANNGRMQLMQDGTARVDNDKAFTVHTPDGTVAQRSATGASAILKATGQVELISSDQASLLLDQLEAKLEGPLNELAQAFGKAKKSLGGFLGVGRRLLKQVSGVADAIQLGGDIPELLQQADAIFQKLDDTLASVPSGLDALKQLQTFSPQVLGNSLAPQLAIALSTGGIGPLAPQIAALVQQSLPIESLLTQVQGILPEGLSAQFNPATLSPILQGLRYSPDMQVQAILSEITPDGFASIQNVLGLGLQDTLSAINLSVFEKYPEPNQERQVEVERRRRSVRELLPSGVRDLIDDKTLESLIQPDLFPSDDPISDLVGHLSRGLIDQSVKEIEATVPWLATVSPLAELTRSLLRGESPTDGLAKLSGTQLGDLVGATKIESPQQIAQQILPAAMAKLAKTLSPALEKGQSTLNQVLNAVPGQSKGGVVKALVRGAEIYANASGQGAIARIGLEAAEMLGPKIGKGRSSLFAGLKGAGIATPKGKLSLGGTGGSLLTSGRLVLQVAQDVGKAVGLVLDESNGVSLSSFFEGARDWGDDDMPPDRLEGARVKADGQSVYVQALSKTGKVLHEIQVSPQGIFANDVPLHELLGRFATLEARIAALESALPPVP